VLSLVRSQPKPVISYLKHLLLSTWIQIFPATICCQILFIHPVIPAVRTVIPANISAKQNFSPVIPGLWSVIPALHRSVCDRSNRGIGRSNRLFTVILSGLTGPSTRYNRAYTPRFLFPPRLDRETAPSSFLLPPAPPFFL
jgi:hypothetical protein